MTIKHPPSFTPSKHLNFPSLLSFLPIYIYKRNIKCLSCEHHPQSLPRDQTQKEKPTKGEKKNMGKKGIHRSLQLYLSKLKKVPILHLANPQNHSNASTSRFLSACKYPKTPSFGVDRDQPDDGSGGARDPAATLSDVDRFLHENFRSLYYCDKDGDELSSGSPNYNVDPPAGTIRSSERFFVSPATSNSLLDEARPSAAASSPSSSLRSNACPAVLGDGVAVMTFTKDPYDDFRRSMQDMVEARHVDPGQPLDWDFMEELLFRYLELNDRSVHKHILRAFTDLTVSYRRRGRRRSLANEGQAAVVPRNFSGGATVRS